MIHLHFLMLLLIKKYSVPDWMFWKMNKHHRPLQEFAMRFFRIPEQGKVLDIGCGGGFFIASMLRRAPEAYTAGEILRAAEGELAPVSCLTEDGKKCGGVCTCYTLPFWRGLEEHINAYIDGYTLRDLLDAKRNTPVCGGTGDADTNSAEKKDTEQ